jgi:hypothetical protein
MGILPMYSQLWYIIQCYLYSDCMCLLLACYRRCSYRLVGEDGNIEYISPSGVFNLCCSLPRCAVHMQFFDVVESDNTVVRNEKPE